MSFAIDIVSVVSQTWIFKMCCDIALRPKVHNRLLRIGIFAIACAAHLLTEHLEFNLSLLLSMAIDYAYISVCYRSNWKTKHILFLFLYLADFGLETVAMSGILRINPTLTPSYIMDHELISLIVAVGIRVTEHIGVFIFREMIKERQSRHSTAFSVTMVSAFSIWVLWFVFPRFWEIQDGKINTAVIILVALLFITNTFIVSNYNTIARARMREMKLSSTIQVERDKIKRLVTAVRGNHGFLSNLTYIRSAIASGEHERAISYMDGLIGDTVLYDENKSITKNMDVDIILQHYVSAALGKDIQLEINCILPLQLPFDTGDIILLINNIMDNAIAAVMKLDSDRYISFCITYNQKRLSIVAKNPYAGRIRRINDTYYSEKHEGPGFGIDIIRYIVDSYAGGCDTYAEDQTYTISIVLQTPN